MRKEEEAMYSREQQPDKEGKVGEMRSEKRKAFLFFFFFFNFFSPTHIRDTNDANQYILRYFEFRFSYLPANLSVN